MVACGVKRVLSIKWHWLSQSISRHHFLQIQKLTEIILKNSFAWNCGVLITFPETARLLKWSITQTSWDFSSTDKLILSHFSEEKKCENLKLYRAGNFAYRSHANTSAEWVITGMAGRFRREVGVGEQLFKYSSTPFDQRMSYLFQTISMRYHY